jgi:hypothetical protein
MVAILIKAVAIQPKIFKRREIVNCLIALGFVAINIIITMIGGATIPFATADQNKVLIELIGVAAIIKPMMVATYLLKVKELIFRL